MKSKEKIKGSIHMKITIKKITGFLVLFTTVLYMYIFYNMYFASSKTYVEESSAITENTIISGANEIDIDEKINQNTNEGQREEYTTEEEILEYITKYNTNEKLPKGLVQVVQDGREGKQEVTKKRIYRNDELIREEQVETQITKASINKIVEIGAGTYTSNYNVKIGDNVYVTSDRVSVMAEANETSQKVATLLKNDELNVLEIVDDWYNIISGTTRGYVKVECTSYLNPNKNNIQTAINEETQTAEKLTSNLNFEMALNKPSGLTLEQFKKVLTDSKDVNKIFENNAEYFYYIEKQYNINGIFVAAVGIHESAWGTSKISKDKKNLFGYGAYDSNPYNGAYDFAEYSESIDLLARVFVKYYINPKGTSIYGGETAMGTYYNGETLSGINTKYASDKNWANAVFSYMKYLYGKI